MSIFRYPKLSEETVDKLRANSGKVVVVHVLDFDERERYRTVTGPLVEAHGIWVSVRHSKGHAPCIYFGDDNNYTMDERRGIVKITTLAGEVLYHNPVLSEAVQGVTPFVADTNIPLKDGARPK